VAQARREGTGYQQSDAAANGAAPPPAAPQVPPEAGPSLGPPPVRATRTRTRRRGLVTGVIILAVLLFCGGALTVTLIHRPAAGTGLASSSSGGPPAGQAAIAGAAAARGAAAAWVARQVDPAAIIACDPQMCAALQGNGIPAARLLLLGSANAAPLGSEVIVCTAVVREELGSRLTTVYAPVALAAFGSGSDQVTVRVVAADGSAAYRRSLQADAAARRTAGAQLLRNPNVGASPDGRRDLAAGQVDARLLTVIAALATPYHVDIIGFGARPAGADPAVPLRSADISVASADGGGAAATLNAAKRFLLAQQPPYRAAEVTTVRLADGRTALRVEFTAPSPLGLLGP